MSSLDPNRKVKVGSTETLHVLMPEYWSGSPTLTFRRDGDDIASVGFAVRRAADTCTAISSRTLTGTFNGTIAGFAGPVWGQAFLVTAHNGVFEVQVDALTATTATLREPLHVAATISAQSTASLVWRWWSAAIPAAVTATETGTSPADWRVEYTANYLGGPGTVATQRFGGLIHVTAERFSTGLSSARFQELMGHLALPRPSPGTMGHAAVIESSRLEVESYVRQRMPATTSGRREDDIIATDPGFVLGHARLAASEMFRFTRPEEAKELRVHAFEAIDSALASSSWFDPEGTGEGETGTPAARPATLVSGSRLPSRADTAVNPFSYRLGRARG